MPYLIVPGIGWINSGRFENIGPGGEVNRPIQEVPCRCLAGQAISQRYRTMKEVRHQTRQVNGGRALASLLSSSFLIRLKQVFVWLKAHLLPRRSALSLNIKTIRSSGFFDIGWYRRQLNDDNITIAHAIRHYLREGAAKGLDPNRYFNTLWYLETNKDVAASGLNPLFHYIKHGAAEGRDPSSMMELLSYLMDSNEESLSYLKANKEADNTVLRSLAVLLDRCNDPKVLGTRSLARASGRTLPTDRVARPHQSFES